MSDQCNLNLISTDDEIKDIVAAVEALAPFEEGTIEMSAEKFATIAKVIPLVRGLKELTKANNNSELAQKLGEHLNEKFTRPEDRYGEISSFGGCVYRFIFYFFKLVFSNET